MRLLSSLALLCAVSGCAYGPLIVEGPSGHPPQADVAAGIAAFAAEAHVAPTFFDGLIVQFDRNHAWIEPDDGSMVVTGITWRKDYIWLLLDERHADVCHSALGHELVHSMLWRATGDPNASHTSTVWKQAGDKASYTDALEARGEAAICKALGQAR